MRDTLHDRVRMAVQIGRTKEDYWIGSEASDQMRALCDLSDRILDRHEGVHYCGARHIAYADQGCPEIRDLAKAWGVDVPHKHEWGTPETQGSAIGRVRCDCGAIK